MSLYSFTRLALPVLIIVLLFFQALINPTSSFLTGAVIVYMYTTACSQLYFIFRLFERAHVKNRGGLIDPKRKEVGFRKGALVLALAGTFQGLQRCRIVERKKEKRPIYGQVNRIPKGKIYSLIYKAKICVEIDRHLQDLTGQNIRINLLAKKPQNTPHKSAHCGSVAHYGCFVRILAVIIYNYNSYQRGGFPNDKGINLQRKIHVVTILLCGRKGSFTPDFRWKPVQRK